MKENKNKTLFFTIEKLLQKQNKQKINFLSKRFKKIALMKIQ